MCSYNYKGYIFKVIVYIYTDMHKLVIADMHNSYKKSN